MSQLTIAIPTYNRNEKLLLHLRRVLPQISDQKVIIIDNCSDVPVSDTLHELILEFKQIDIKIFRNKANVGIIANFLRCFEYCETEWMWLLSDDDPAYPTAIQIVERDIALHADYNFINYASSMVEEGVSFATVIRSKSFSTTGIDEFISEFDLFVNLIFVSSGVYNISRLLPHIRIGYIYSYSLVSHILIVMQSLGDSGKVFFSKDKLVDFTPPASGETWSRLTFCQAITTMLEAPLPLSDKAFATLSDKITMWFMSDLELYFEVIRVNRVSKLKTRFVFVQLLARTMLKKRTFKQKFLLVRLLIRLFWFTGKNMDNLDEQAKQPLYRI